jgi:hypothetical protein
LLLPALRRARDVIDREPLRAFLAIATVAVTLYAAFAPLVACRYPPMTDLPFHAAHTSILRHYWDPAWHFREQFELHPIAVPYMTQYALGALFETFLSPLAAVKAAAGVMLLCVPAGMAVLLHGMKRSPLAAVLTTPIAYGTLAHWGFISFVAALGLFAAAVGFAMMVVDRPTRARRAALAITLVLLFFTHIFRFPMGVAAVIGAAVFLYPATRRFRPILLPLVPSLVLFAAWLVVRPRQLETGGMALHLDLARKKDFWPILFSGFVDPSEGQLAETCAKVAGFVGVASLFAILAEGRLPDPEKPRQSLFSLGASLVPVACALVFLGLYFVLPMQIGVWWYVYPREATAALFMAVAVLPGLPRSLIGRAPLVMAALLTSLTYARFIAHQYAAFDSETADFDRIKERIPQAPRLLYLVFDHWGSTRNNTPFIHLPAWIQAERGGFLSFHFAQWGASPIAFRSPDEPGAVVPPKTPLRWEWTPHLFRVEQHAPFFDWFLVRANVPADSLFEADKEIVRVDHVGKWWLYHRLRRAPEPSP